MNVCTSGQQIHIVISKMAESEPGFIVRYHTAGNLAIIVFGKSFDGLKQFAQFCSLPIFPLVW